MHYKQKHVYVGIDLHKETHTAVVIDCWNKKLAEVQIANRPTAFSTLLEKVRRAVRGLQPVFGLEDVGGYGRSLAVFLLEKGQVVKEVNAALSYAQRISNPTTQKSDSWDAFCVACVLLARFAGIAPVRFSSAGKGKDQKSRQGNRTLHGIFYFLAVQQVQVAKCSQLPRNPVMYQYYQKKLSEGKTKMQALVCVMRKLVNIVYRMMRNRTEYVMPALPEKVAV